MALEYTGIGYFKIVDRTETTSNFYTIKIDCNEQSRGFLIGTNEDLSLRGMNITTQGITTVHDEYSYFLDKYETQEFYSKDQNIWARLDSINSKVTLLDTADKETLAAAIPCIKLSDIDSDDFLIGGGGGAVTAADVSTADGSNAQVKFDNLETVTSVNASNINANGNNIVLNSDLIGDNATAIQINLEAIIALENKPVDAAQVVDVIEGNSTSIATKLVLHDLDGLGTNALAFKNRSFILQDEATAETTFVETSGQPVFFQKEMLLNAGVWHADGISTDGNNERGVIFNAPLKEADDYILYRDIGLTPPYGNFKRQRFDVVPVVTVGTTTSFVYNNVFIGGSHGGGTFSLVFYKTTAGTYPWTTLTTASETPQGLGVTVNYTPSQADCKAISLAGYPIDIKIKAHAGTTRKFLYECLDENDLSRKEFIDYESVPKFDAPIVINNKKITHRKLVDCLDSKGQKSVGTKLFMYYVVRQEVIDAGVVTGVAGDRLLAESNGTVDDNYTYLPLISLWEYSNNLATNDLAYHNVSNVQLYMHLMDAYYIVYDISDDDKLNLQVEAEGTITVGSTLRDVTIVSSPVEHTFDGTEFKLLELTYTEFAAIKKTSIFTTYQLTTDEEIKTCINAHAGVSQFKTKTVEQLKNYFSGYSSAISGSFLDQTSSITPLLGTAYLEFVVKEVSLLPLTVEVPVAVKEVFYSLVRDPYYKYISNAVILDF